MRLQTLPDRLTRLTLELRYDAAANRLMTIAQRLAELSKYNPNWASQPRVPAGDRDGGQWARSGGGAGPNSDADEQNWLQTSQT